MSLQDDANYNIVGYLVEKVCGSHFLDLRFLSYAHMHHHELRTMASIQPHICRIDNGRASQRAESDQLHT